VLDLNIENKKLEESEKIKAYNKTNISKNPKLSLLNFEINTPYTYNCRLIYL
jgi:hypothetical protein